MDLFGLILLGLIVGFLARGLLPGRQKLGWILTAALGIAGSVLAGQVGQALGWYAPGEAAGWVASVAAAVLLLWVGTLIKR